MSVRQAVAKQYRAKVDHAMRSIGRQPVLNEGWIATTRQALGMPAAQLARRLGVTRARVSQAEQAELAGGVTLKTLQSMAAAMGCRLVYAIVPVEGNVDDLISAQARRKAEALVANASDHMALELQSLPDEKNRAEVERIAADLARAMPADFWANG